MKKLLSILPTQSLIYFLICGAGILFFVFMIIVPTQKTSAELDKEFVKISDRIEEQRILKPVFESLLKQAKKKNPTDCRQLKKLHWTASISVNFQRICRKWHFGTGLKFKT